MAYGSTFRKLILGHLVLIYGETVETVADFIFWAPKSLQMVFAAMK